MKIRTIFAAVILTLISNIGHSADNLLCGPAGSSQCYLIDASGNKWRAKVAMTTDGNGDIFTLGDVASTDNIIGVNTSGNRTLIDNLNRRWSVDVTYTTDGNGHVIPVPTGGGGGGAAWGSITGTLSSQTDLQTALNAKQNLLTLGNLTETGSANLSVTGGTGAVIGSGVSLSLIGSSIVEATSSVLTFTGAANSVLGTGVSIQVKQSATGQSGYLSSSDWNTFNGKQASGNYITALTGQVTAAGPGSSAATIAANTVTNANRTQMAANTFKGNNTGSTANEADLSVSQMTTALGNTSGTVSTLVARDSNGVSVVQVASPQNLQSGTSYTLVASDNGKQIIFSNASSVTLTVPSGLGATFSCIVIQNGAGTVTPTASSTTLHQRQSFTKTAGQYAVLTLSATATDTFVMGGDMQ